MKRYERSWFFGLACMLLFLFSMGSTIPINGSEQGSGSIDTIDDTEKETLKEKALSLTTNYFIQNIGQIDSDDIMFYSGGGDVYFTPTGVIYRFREMEPIQEEDTTQVDIPDPMRDTPNAYREWGVVLKYSFIGANRVVPEGRDRCSWNTNYFKGSDPEKWYTEVSNFREVLYRDLWDRIDLVYRQNEKGMKYDLILRPGADPSDIQIRIEGHNALSISEKGDLIINTKYWNIMDSGLYAYKKGDFMSHVDCTFTLIGKDIYSFKLKNYEIDEEVVIDPVLSYSTFIGGSKMDSGTRIAIDPYGNSHVVGITSSVTDYPITIGAYDITFNGYLDIFVTAINKNSSSLLYSTYIGGSNSDYGNSIVIDSKGNIAITGYTLSSDYPVSPGALDKNKDGANDVIVTKMNLNCSSIIFSTYIGGKGHDIGTKITVDLYDNLFITGGTLNSTENYPTTIDAYDNSHNGNYDAFVTKIRSDGTSILYSTFLGGSDDDYGAGIIIDSNGDVYITGNTKIAQVNYPITLGSYNTKHNGGDDIFITKINNDGKSLIYSVLIGGTSNEWANGITIDKGGNSYITGSTQSRDYPTTSNCIINKNNGGLDVILTKLDSGGKNLIYSSYIGGSNDEEGTDITLDKFENVYLIGYTYSSNFPITADAYDSTLNGIPTIFVNKFNLNNNSSFYSTFFGGSIGEYGYGIAANNYSIVITGNTASNDYPLTQNAFDLNFNGDSDAFITILMIDTDPPIINIINDVKIGYTGDTYQFKINVTDNQGVSAVFLQYWFGTGTTMNISMLGTGPYTYSIMIPSNSIEVLHYIIHANDTSNNWNQTVERIVKVLDNDAPAFGEEIAPAIGTTNDLFDIDLNITDNIGVTYVYIEYWFGDNAHINEDMFERGNGTGTYSYIINVPWNCTDSLHYFIYANDTSDNWNNTKERIVTIIDDDSPYFGSDPIPTEVGTGDLLQFSIHAYDNIGILAVYFEYWFGEGMHENETLGGLGDCLIEVAIPMDSVEPLNYIISVVDSSGNWASINGTILVMDTIPPVIVPISDMVVDEDRPITFNGSDSYDNIGIVNWTWSIMGSLEGDQYINLYGKDFEYFFLQPGIYRIILNVWDYAVNWDYSSFNITVRDVTNPKVGVIFEIGIDEYTLFIFDGSGSSDNVGIVNWTWSFEDGEMNIVLYGVSPRYKFEDPGIYNISLTVKDAASLSSSGYFLINVKDVTKPEIDAGSDRTVMEGTIVSFEATGSDNVGIVDWTWRFIFNSTPIELKGQKVEFNFTLSGNYSIVCNATDEAGNSKDDTLTVNVKPIEHIPENETEEKDHFPWYIIAIAVLAAIIVGIVLFFVLRKKKEPSEIVIARSEDIMVPPEPPTPEPTSVESTSDVSVSTSEPTEPNPQPPVNDEASLEKEVDGKPEEDTMVDPDQLEDPGSAL